MGSAQLNALGVIHWMAGFVDLYVQSMGLPWQLVFVLVMAAYMWSHYLFASQVAHISSLFQPAVAILITSGCPPKLAVLALAYLGNVFATLTSYASAHAPVFASARASGTDNPVFSPSEWWRITFLFSIANF